MQILIDNFDGLGSIDYTEQIHFNAKATITRRLNQPSICTFSVLTEAEGKAVPRREARIVVFSPSSQMLFTGYIASSPTMTLASQGEKGSIYVAAVIAVSDELLLDKIAITGQATLLGNSAQASWSGLATLSSSVLPINLSQRLTKAGRFQVAPGEVWSALAGTLADCTQAAYRCLDSTIQVKPFGEVSHTLESTTPGLSFTPTSLDDLRLLAQDVTICGGEEPSAYVTQVFEGDGATTSFNLSQPHFSPLREQTTNIQDLFQGTTLNPRLWSVQDAAGHIALTSGGLTCIGGSGTPNEAVVASMQPLELGGTVVIEASGVRIGAGSAGILLGLYNGGADPINCIAGFQVSSASESVLITPFTGEGNAGSSFQASTASLYTMRLRIHSMEMERVRQSYFYLSGSTVGSIGGDAVPSSGYVSLEIQDTTSGGPGAAIVLYSGVIGNLPTDCVITLLSSGSLNCSLKSIQCAQTSPFLVAVSNGTDSPLVQSEGALINGGRYSLTQAGAVTFYPGNVPPQGSLIYVSYRLKARAIARGSLNSSLQPAPLVPTQTWMGTVQKPPAWSCVDCQNATTALLQTSAAASAALKGEYKGINANGSWTGGDIWPGDSLLLNPEPNSTEVVAIVRQVIVELLPEKPELISYSVSFANDSADVLSMKLSATVPTDALIPQQPTRLADALTSLTTMHVILAGNILSIATGASAPVGGGFEVRRRDNTFGTGSNSDLVVQTATEIISIPRLAPIEEYYVRMYDGATPPNYSLHSAAIFLNVLLK